MTWQLLPIKRSVVLPMLCPCTENSWRMLTVLHGHWRRSDGEGPTCEKLLGMYRSSVFKHQPHVFT